MLSLRGGSVWVFPHGTHARELESAYQTFRFTYTTPHLGAFFADHR